jgi:homoprotocatechuate degradation regulator HpaR
MRSNVRRLEIPSPPADGLRPLEHSLAINLLRAREAVMTHFRPQLLENDLSEQQWRVIRALAEGGAIDAGTAAQRSCVHPASFSRILRSLQKRGLLAARPCTADSRRLLVELTSAGRELFERMAPLSEAIYRRLEHKLGKDTIADAVRMAQAISSALRD